jgi:hypothetical protein
VTTGYGYASGPGAMPLGEEPPPNVTAMAHSRQLGPRLASRKLANPLAVFGLSILASAASLGMLILFSWIGQSVDGVLHAIVRFGGLFFCFAFVGALVYGLATLARGAQSFHVYAGGFVHRRNSKVSAYNWPEVAELRPVIGKRGDTAGKLQSYQLVPRSGSPIGIPLAIENGRDPFMDQLMAVLQQHGIRVS